MRFQVKNFRVLLVLIFSCLLAQTSYASGDKGNGGDGVLRSDDTIILYDFFERGVDADKNFQASADAKVSNYMLSKALASLPSENLNGSLWQNKEKTMRVLESVLQRLGRNFPVLTTLVVEELKLLKWNEASEDLPVNSDTASFLDPTEVTIIGCAKNVHSIISYSPSCGQKMSHAQKAGLAVHEAIYSLYKREWQPGSATSFNVRSVVSEIFDNGSGSAQDLRRLFHKAGFAQLNELEEKVNTLFFGNNKHYAAHTSCVFSESSPIAKVAINYSDALRIDGWISHVDESLNRQGQDHIIGSSWRAAVSSDPYWGADPESIKAWIPSLPKFDISSETLSISFERSDKRRLTAVTSYATKELRADYFDGSEWQKGLAAKCERVR